MTTRIAQLSDTHFLEPGEAAEGGFAYDTAVGFDAVAEDIAAHTDDFDLVTVTGDVADHGRAAQYDRAAAAFATLGLPVNVTPGNHDQHAAFTAGIGRPAVSTSRVVRLGSWCHLFVDSNAGVMTEADGGHLVDPERYDDRLHGNGMLGARESAWIREQAEASDADHLFVWLHHPPAPSAAAPLCHDDAYEAEWRALLPALPRLRGIGGGHTHVPTDYMFGEVPVFMAPSLKNNFDLEAKTLLPPGYRTYAFSDDGTVTSEVRLIDDNRWPRHPYGRAVHGLLMGELDWETFNEIVTRKQASNT